MIPLLVLWAMGFVFSWFIVSASMAEELNPKEDDLGGWSMVWLAAALVSLVWPFLLVMLALGWFTRLHCQWKGWR